MVDFDGRKIRQAGFIVFAWDPKATDEYMSSFSDPCKENDIEVRAKALGRQLDLWVPLPWLYMPLGTH